MAPLALVVVVPPRVWVVPLKVTVSAEEAAKPLPVTVTVVPATALVVFKLAVGVTVKFPAAALWPSTVTTTACAPARLPEAVAGMVKVGGVVVGMAPAAVVV